MVGVAFSSTIVPSDIYEQIVFILSRLSDSAQGRRGSQAQAFKHRLYFSALEQARMLILGKYVLLSVIHTIYKHCQA